MRISALLTVFLVGAKATYAQTESLSSVVGGGNNVDDAQHQLSTTTKQDTDETFLSTRRIQNANFDYFQFEITIRPNTSKVAGSCTAGDLASIGEAIDQAIHSLTLPEDIPGEESRFIAGLCTAPKAVPPLLRQRSRSLQGSPGWVWNGGGGRCHQCPPDNGDRGDGSKKTSTNIFLKGKTLIKKVELLLVYIVLNDVVPNFPCLGSNPTVDVKVTAVDATQLRLGCGDSVPPSMGIQGVLNTLP